MKVSYDGPTAPLPLIIAKGDGPTGRNWLQKITLNWSKIHYTPSSGMHDLLEKYKELFLEGLGTLQGFQAKFSVD